MTRYWILTLFLILPFAFAETCIEQLPGALESNISGVGSLYFYDAKGNQANSNFTFFGGICLEGKEGWQLLTERIEVTALPEARAENVTVSFQGWQLQASFLQASPAGLTMQGITFFAEGIKGVAQEASYDFTSQEINLIKASTEGKNLRIEGQEATLVDGKVFFADIEATTCNCENDPLYKLSAQQATLELNTQKLFIDQGTLFVLGLPVALNNLEISPESLETFTFPIVIEYVPEDSSNNKGTGLGIRIPSWRVDEHLNLELGVVGLDNIYPLGGILLTHYKDGITSFDVGYASEGFQADVKVKQPLSSTTHAVFAVRNRDWKSQDFLHEGSLGFETTSSLPWLGNDTLSYSLSGFTAISSQTLDSLPFHDGRLGTEATLRYQLPPSAFGNLEVNLKTNLTYYPLHHQAQWGVRFNPSWHYQYGAFGIRIGFIEQWTNSASPFSTKLDRLEPQSQLSLSTSLNMQVSKDVKGELSFRVRYDFLDVDTSMKEGFTELGFNSKLMWTYKDLTFAPYVTGEFASALNPDLSTNSYLEAGMDALAPRWEAGFSTRFDTDFSLSKIEFKTAFPIDINKVILKPFIAIDVLPILQAGDFPRISGHGLELTWRSCCGTISLGYRQQENTFKTLIGFTLE